MLCPEFYYKAWYILHKVDGLVQERRNSSALAMEFRLSCINSSQWYGLTPTFAMITEGLYCTWKFYRGIIAPLGNISMGTGEKLDLHQCPGPNSTQ